MELAAALLWPWARLNPSQKLRAHIQDVFLGAFCDDIKKPLLCGDYTSNTRPIEIHFTKDLKIKKAPPVKNNAYIRELDGLRALSVLLVIFFHLRLWRLSGGFIGVDVFFVISGYLISRLLINEKHETGNIRLMEFYARRARRILPALYFTIFFFLLLGLLLLSPSSLSQLGVSAAAAATSLSNIYFWAKLSYFDSLGGLQPLLHTWSLGIEEQFYLIWPFFIMLIARIKSRTKTILLLLTIGSISLILNIGMLFTDTINLVPSNWLLNHALHYPNQTMFFLLPFRVFEFVTGAFVLQLAPCPTIPTMKTEVFTVFGLVMIIASGFLITGDQPFPGYVGLFPCIGAAMVIYSIRSRIAAIILGNRLMVWIGLISYSLYLVHWPLIVFYRYLLLKNPSGVSALLLIVLSIALASLMYMYIERPFRQVGDSRFAMPLMTLSTAFFATLLLVIASAAIVLSNGASWRVRKYQQNITEYATHNESDIIPDVQHAKYRLALVGESHSTHFLNLARSYFGPKNVSVVNLTGSGCLPIPGLITVRNLDDYNFGDMQRTCSYFTNHLVPSYPEKYDGLILAARWALYLEQPIDNSVGTENQTYFVVYDRHFKKSALSDTNSKMLFSKQLFLWLQKIQAEHVPVLIMGQVPPTGINLLDCVTRPRIIFDPRGCHPVLTKSQVEARLSFANKQFAAAATRFTDVLFANSFQILCSNAIEYCPFQINDVYLYRDDNHLNMHASTSLVPEYTPIFAKFYAMLAKSGGTERGARTNRSVRHEKPNSRELN